MTDAAPPFALFIRSHKRNAFDIAETLGFETAPAGQDFTEPLAISIFEDGPETMAIQALFETEDQAMACFNARVFDEAMKDGGMKDGHMQDQGGAANAVMESFVTQLPDEDWVSLSQQGLPPVPAGRFFVYGSHDAEKIPPEAEFPVEINAGLAFGTGHHGTTRGCLLMFDALLSQGQTPKRVLDLGCGAGILAIAAAKALQIPILATDIDPDAKMVTEQNAQINGVTPLINAHVADGFDADILKGKSFDLIFANILAGPLTGLAPDIYSSLASGGHVILSGILDEQAGWVAKSFTDLGMKITPQNSLAGWTSLLGTKLSQ